MSAIMEVIGPILVLLLMILPILVYELWLSPRADDRRERKRRGLL